MGEQPAGRRTVRRHGRLRPAVRRAGSPLGDEFLVNEYTTGDQIQPRVAADESGNFIVVWAGQGATDSTGVHGRLFTANGTPTGPEFTVHPATPGNAEIHPAVARSDTGYVVVWEQDTPSDGHEIYGAVFTEVGAAGKRVSRQHAHDGRPGLSRGRDGRGRQILRELVELYANGAEIRGTGGFTAAGAPLSEDFQINTYTTGYQLSHSVASDGAGGFVVVWNDNILGYPLRAQRIDTTGAASGAERVIGDGKGPRIHHRALGGFLVSYDSNGLFASHYDDALNRLAPEFLLTNVLTGGTPRPSGIDGRHRTARRLRLG